MPFLRPGAPVESARQLALDAALTVGELHDDIASQLRWVAEVFHPDEAAAAAAAVAPELADAARTLSCVERTAARHPSGRRASTDAAQEYAAVMLDLDSTLAGLRRAVGTVREWVELPQAVSALTGQVSAQVNTARQACSAAAGTGRDVAAWQRQVSRSQVAQHGAAVAAGEGRFYQAERALRAQLDPLAMVVQDAMSEPMAQAAAHAEVGLVEELADRVRELGQDATQRWVQLQQRYSCETLAPVSSNIQVAADAFRQALSTLDDSSGEDQQRPAKAKELLEQAHELLEAVMSFCPDPLGEAADHVADGAAGDVGTAAEAESTCEAGDDAALDVHASGACAPTSLPAGQDGQADVGTSADRIPEALSDTSAQSASDRVQQILSRVQAQRMDHGPS